MRLFEPTMLAQVDIFIEQLFASSKSGVTINVTERTKFLSLDIVGHLAFGYDLKLQTDPTNRHMVGTLKGGNYRLNISMQYPLLAKLHLEVIVYILMLMKKDSYLGLLDRMIKTRLGQEKNAKHDLYSIVSTLR